MRRFIESGVALGVILILAGALFASLNLERLSPDIGRAGAAWNPMFAQQTECVQGKYAEGCEKYSAKIDPNFYGEGGQVGVAPVGGLDAYASSSAAGGGAAGQVGGLAYAGGAPGTAGAPSARFSYLYAGRQLARFDGANVQFVHGDHLGTGAARTAAGGTVVESSRQLPFGTQLGSISRETDFTGKKIDPPSNLHYYGARYHLSTAGRFSNVDPLFSPQDGSYVYVKNNPFKFTDPTGERIEGGELYAADTGIGDSQMAQFNLYSSDRPWWHPEQLLAGLGNLIVTADNMILSTLAVPDMALAGLGMEAPDREAIYFAMGMLQPELAANSRFVSSIGAYGRARAATALSRVKPATPKVYPVNELLAATDAANGINYAAGVSEKLSVSGSLLTTSEGTPFSGNVAWVVNKEGGLVFAPRRLLTETLPLRPTDTKLPHPLLSRGEGVQGAGEGWVVNGQIKNSIPLTGHFYDINNPAEFSRNSMATFWSAVERQGISVAEGATSELPFFGEQ